MRLEKTAEDVASVLTTLQLSSIAIRLLLCTGEGSENVTLQVIHVLEEEKKKEEKEKER